jgi:hypothetical protein
MKKTVHAKNLFSSAKHYFDHYLVMSIYKYEIVTSTVL